MRTRIALALLTSALAAVAIPGAAQASIAVVNQNDSGPGSLRKAVEEAPSGETIVLPPGTYTLLTEITIGVKTLTIAGHGAGDTIIRAGADKGLLRDVIAKVEVSGVTFREAQTAGGFAGVLNLGGDLTLRDVVITDNRISENGTPGNPGGSGADGAGIRSEGGGSLTLIDSTVSGNVVQANGGTDAKGGAASGAGVYVREEMLKVEGSTIAGNIAEARGGQNVVSSPEQDGGVATGAGLAALSPTGQQVSIVDSTFSGNSADASAGPGGEAGQVAAVGLFVATTGGGSATASGLTIAGNAGRTSGAAGPESNAIAGGVLIVAGPTSSASLLGTTIAGNRVEGLAGKTKAGNLLADGAVRIGDTLVSGGAAGPGFENCDIQPPSSPSEPAPTSLGYNLDSLDQCGFHASGDQVNKDPQLGPLQNNGGPTQTMLPAVGSPAIDGGSSFGLLTDQRGAVRPIDFPAIADPAGGNGADIGAVEVQPLSGLALGKPAKNKKKGTATIAVTLPQPAAGALALTGKGLKTQTVPVTAKPAIKLSVIAKGSAAKKLRKKGKLKVKFEVAYTPAGGQPPAIRSGSAMLVFKHRKHHRHPKR